MKKKLIIFTALTICLMLVLTACTGSNPGDNPPSGNTNTPASTEPAQPSNSDDSGNKGIAEELTASIIPAEGWEKHDSLSSTRIQYVYAATGNARNTLINVDTEENILGRTARGFVEKRMESQKLTLESWKPVFTDIADISVSDYDALAYDVVTESGELQKMIFIFKGSYVYIIQCVTTTEFWEIVRDDFTAMIESFTLE